ncbi:cytochrome c peroxidase [Thiovulum sp. ES]|nr:cytochrome c peroxidase [Thiovulum sp. ES]
MKKIFFVILISSYIFAENLITPLIEIPEFNLEKARLGKIIFLDKDLSKDRKVSCASCHDLENGGNDGKRFSQGNDNQEGNVNSPTVFNSRFNFRQFWNGRAKSLEEQALFPILNPMEMGLTIREVLEIINGKDFYVENFQRIYGEKATIENIVDSLVEFEKSLVTINSKFDRYLAGDKKALNSDEVEGYEIFVNRGCINCHNGINIGGNSFNKFGIFLDSNSIDYGRFELTNDREDKYFFKVPTLRNIELTAPYFHDGRTNSLREAVYMMGNVQLGLELSDDELDKLVIFLKTLTGNYKSF